MNFKDFMILGFLLNVSQKNTNSSISKSSSAKVIDSMQKIVFGLILKSWSSTTADCSKWIWCTWLSQWNSSENCFPVNSRLQNRAYFIFFQQSFMNTLKCLFWQYATSFVQNHKIFDFIKYKGNQTGLWFLE